MKPLLPLHAEIAPYLERIDQSRYYSNFGGLVTEFEERLSGLFGSPCVSAASGTAALTATIMALGLPARSFIACPSWSFVATAAAIVSAGHIPFFHDVSEDGVLFAGEGIHKCSAVILVSPYGKPLMWNDDYSMPTIIDAAAGFDSFSTICKPGKLPVVVSTHCTKPFGTGEGGFVSCSDESLLKKVRHITNFGIESKTNTPLLGINGKMSEYHAAVGLAELNGWQSKREKWLQVKRWYGDNSGWASSSMPVRAAKTIMGAMPSRYGIHTLKAYQGYPKTDLSITEILMKETQMLPCWVDMKQEDVVGV